MKVLLTQYFNPHLSSNSIAFFSGEPIRHLAQKEHYELAKNWSKRPLDKKAAMQKLRSRISPNKDTPVSRLDCVLPAQPLRQSLQIWTHDEIVSNKATGNEEVQIKRCIQHYFQDAVSRLDFQLNLIRVANCVAMNTHYCHWCCFHSMKQIGAYLSISPGVVSSCLREMEERDLIEIKLCRSKLTGQVTGSYVRVRDKFKALFLSGLEWPDSKSIYGVVEDDYSKHLHQIELIGRELQSLIRSKKYPEPTVNWAYYLLTY